MNLGQSVDVEAVVCFPSSAGRSDRPTLICSWRDLVWWEGRTCDGFGVGGGFRFREPGLESVLRWVEEEELLLLAREALPFSWLLGIHAGMM